MGKFDEIILADIRRQLEIPVETPIALEFLNSIEYQRDKYDDVKSILKNHDLVAIKSLISEGNGGVSDNLLIYILKQKEESDRLIVVLDKFDVWSNPSILDII
jgi:hypothetical protein